MSEPSPEEAVSRGYNVVADKYAWLEQTEWTRLRWVRKLLQTLPSGSRVLDLGCGSGDPADVEIARSHAITGVDISAAQIERATKNVPDGRI